MNFSQVLNKYKNKRMLKAMVRALFIITIVKATGSALDLWPAAKQLWMQLYEKF